MADVDPAYAEMGDDVVPEGEKKEIDPTETAEEGKMRAAHEKWMRETIGTANWKVDRILKEADKTNKPPREYHDVTALVDDILDEHGIRRPEEINRYKAGLAHCIDAKPTKARALRPPLYSSSRTLECLSTTSVTEYHYKILQASSFFFVRVRTLNTMLCELETKMMDNPPPLVRMTEAEAEAYRADCDSEVDSQGLTATEYDQQKQEIDGETTDQEEGEEREQEDGEEFMEADGETTDQEEEETTDQGEGDGDEMMEADGDGNEQGAVEEKEQEGEEEEMEYPSLEYLALYGRPKDPNKNEEPEEEVIEPKKKRVVWESGFIPWSGDMMDESKSREEKFRSFIDQLFSFVDHPYEKMVLDWMVKCMLDAKEYGNVPNDTIRRKILEYYKVALPSLLSSPFEMELADFSYYVQPRVISLRIDEEEEEPPWRPYMAARAAREAEKAMKEREERRAKEVDNEDEEKEEDEEEEGDDDDEEEEEDDDDEYEEEAEDEEMEDEGASEQGDEEATTSTETEKNNDGLGTVDQDDAMDDGYTATFEDSSSSNHVMEDSVKRMRDTKSATYYSALSGSRSSSPPSSVLADTMEGREEEKEEEDEEERTMRVEEEMEKKMRMKVVVKQEPSDAAAEGVMDVSPVAATCDDEDLSDRGDDPESPTPIATFLRKMGSAAPTSDEDDLASRDDSPASPDQREVREPSPIDNFESDDEDEDEEPVPRRFSRSIKANLSTPSLPKRGRSTEKNPIAPRGGFRGPLKRSNPTPPRPSQKKKEESKETPQRRSLNALSGSKLATSTQRKNKKGEDAADDALVLNARRSPRGHLQKMTPTNLKGKTQEEAKKADKRRSQITDTPTTAKK